MKRYNCERSKQLLICFQKLNGGYTTIYIVITFILWRVIVILVKAGPSEGQARSNTSLRGWNYPFVASPFIPLSECHQYILGSKSLIPFLSFIVPDPLYSVLYSVHDAKVPIG